MSELNETTATLMLNKFNKTKTKNKNISPGELIEDFENEIASYYCDAVSMICVYNFLDFSTIVFDENSILKIYPSNENNEDSHLKLVD